MNPLRDAGHSVQLRKACPADAPHVLWLEEVCMKDHATALWGQWRPADTLATLDLAGHEMIAWQGRAAGCLATNQTPEALHLSRLYLAPDARNHGVGTQVLGQVITRANQQQIPTKLSVLITNPAVRFYQRHRFCVQRKTSERYLMIRPYSPSQEDATHENH
ncbi:acetyltransferase (GNAT) family protein [Yoonia maricola]|uniref:Acetyltransferase (GNAT) family protein n=1 Tax=Yoonia maricola TaxID=420999 RepID=A0A2M8W096_9RHOB|nr:GNAT family N-acetyltransferase [Yoonia maricola]PJI84332.1 acetyltransferase (GNAT) family protein [Yoonia maricola]